MIDHLKRLTLYFCFLDILYKYKRKQTIAHKQIQWNKNYSAALRSWILSNFYDFGNYNFANHLQVIAQHCAQQNFYDWQQYHVMFSVSFQCLHTKTCRHKMLKYCCVCVLVCARLKLKSTPRQTKLRQLGISFCPSPANFGPRKIFEPNRHGNPQSSLQRI